MDGQANLDPIAERYLQPLLRVMQTYPPGHPGLVNALAQLCQTAHTNGFTAGVNSSAEGVCEGLHAGPPKGVKCRTCYEAEHNFAATLQVEAEIEASWKRGGGGEVEPLPMGEVIEDEDAE